MKLTPDADINETHRVGHIDLSPARLALRFGPGVESDGYKVDREYLFTDDDGNVFTLYAYKATSLYDSGLPDPDAFWRQRSAQEFSIGGTTSPDKFIQWLSKQLTKGK